MEATEAELKAALGEDPKWRYVLYHYIDGKRSVSVARTWADIEPLLHEHLPPGNREVEIAALRGEVQSLTHKVEELTKALKDTEHDLKIDIENAIEGHLNCEHRDLS
jgi:hypothetical protein